MKGQHELQPRGEQGEPCCSWGHFHVQSEEFGLRDDKSDIGLCPSCCRRGREAWELLRACAAMLHPAMDARHQKAFVQINAFEKYFARGGTLYQLLERESDCARCCLQRALPDPADEGLCVVHENHKHAKGDATAGECNDAFEQVMDDAATQHRSMGKGAVVATSDGSRHPATLESTQGGCGYFKFADDKPEAPKEARILWAECDVAKGSMSVNQLALWQAVSNLQKSHM